MINLPDKLLFRPDEVAIIFDISIKTVYNWCATGILKSINPSGKCLRIRRASVVKWVGRDLLEKGT